MSVQWEDLVVVATLVLSARALHALGFRARSGPIALVLVALPLVAWVACKTWLYPALEGAGMSRIVGAVPAIATYLGVVLIVMWNVGGLTYRVGPEGASFGRSLRAADLAMRRAYEEVPKQSSTGQILVEPLRQRLENALVELTVLEPPPGAWTRLLAERIDLHRAYVEILTSPVPLGPDELAPIEKRSHEWMREIQDLVASEERAQS